MNLRCLLNFHDYDYFTMTRLDGGTEHHRCCLRCEKSELLSVKLAPTPQEIGRGNLLALFGVTTPTGLDEGNLKSDIAMLG